MMGISNKGKTLYKCRDCGKERYLRSIVLNRRNGDRCMDCGSRLEPKSGNAIKRLRVGADHKNEPRRGDIKKIHG